METSVTAETSVIVMAEFPDSEDIARLIVAALRDGGGCEYKIISDHRMADPALESKDAPEKGELRQKKYRVVMRCANEKCKHEEVLGRTSNLVTAMQIYMQMRTLIEYLQPCWCGSGMDVYLEVFIDGNYKVWKKLWCCIGGDMCVAGLRFGEKYT